MRKKGWNGIFIFEQHGQQVAPEFRPVADVDREQLPSTLIEMQKSYPYFRMARGLNFNLGRNVIPVFSHDDLADPVTSDLDYLPKIIPHTLLDPVYCGTGVGGIEFQFLHSRSSANKKQFSSSEHGIDNDVDMTDDSEDSEDEEGHDNLESSRSQSLGTGTHRNPKPEEETRRSRPVGATLYLAGLKRLIIKYIGLTRLQDILFLNPRTARYSRLKHFYQGSESVAREFVEGTGPGKHSLCLARYETQHGGLTWAEAETAQKKYFEFLGVPDLLSPTCENRVEKLFNFLSMHGIGVYTIPVELVLNGFTRTLQDFNDVTLKFCRPENKARMDSRKNVKDPKDDWKDSKEDEWNVSENKENQKEDCLDSNQRKLFVALHAEIFARFGFRRPKHFAAHESRILTDVAAHRQLACDLVENLALVQVQFKDVFGDVQDGYTYVTRRLSHVKKSQRHQIGISHGSVCGICPKCQNQFESLEHLRDRNCHTQHRYREESKHVQKCTGQFLGDVNTEEFIVFEDETLENVATMLGENVYVLLSLNLGRIPCGTELTVKSKLKEGTAVLVPASMIDRRPENDSGYNSIYRRQRPEREVKTRRLRSGTQTNITFQEPKMVIAYIVFLARKAWRKPTPRSFRQNIQEYFDWRYTIPFCSRPIYSLPPLSCLLSHPSCLLPPPSSLLSPA